MKSFEKTRRAAIVAPLRTPVGKFLGTLAMFRSNNSRGLSSTVFWPAPESIRRSSKKLSSHRAMRTARLPASADGPALAAGLPVEVPGIQLDRRCGGGLQAIVTAAMMIESNAADVVLAGGVESMSNIEYYNNGHAPWRPLLQCYIVRFAWIEDENAHSRWRFGLFPGWSRPPKTSARDFGITRESCDAFAAESHLRANQAMQQGRFQQEIGSRPGSSAAQGDPHSREPRRGYSSRHHRCRTGKLKSIIPGGRLYRRQLESTE